MKQFSTHALSGALLGTHVRAWALTSTHEYGVIAPLLLMNADGRQQPHGCHLYDRSWALKSVHCSIGPSLWVFIASHEWCSWAILSTHEHPLALMSTNKQPTEVISIPDCQRALSHSHKHSWAMSNEHPWELKSSHEHGAMRLWVLISIYDLSWRHSTMLMSASKCSWGHMRAHEHLWELMSAHNRSWVLNCTIKQ